MGVIDYDARWDRNTEAQTNIRTTRVNWPWADLMKKNINSACHHNIPTVHLTGNTTKHPPMFPASNWGHLVPVHHTRSNVNVTRIHHSNALCKKEVIIIIIIIANLQI